MLKFNNKLIPSFVKVRAVHIQALADISFDTYNNSTYIGVNAGKTVLGAKMISADVSIVIPKGKNLQWCSRELAKWLKGNNFRESELIILDDEEIMYKAKINSNVAINDLIHAGEGTLDFIVPSGVGLDVVPTETSGLSGEAVSVRYEGSADYFPIINITMNQIITTEFTVKNSKGGVFYIHGNFKSGDVLSIDSSNMLVKVNDKLTVEIVGIKSKPILLKEGNNNITCTATNSSISVNYRKAWL